MTLFTTTLQALAPLFLLIVLGHALKRGRVLHAAHVPILNGLVVNVTLPALIVHALVSAPHLPLLFARPPLALFVAQCLTMALAFGLGAGLRLPRPRLGAVLMTGVFGNTAFLGYPIVLSLLPREFPAAVLLDQFGMTIMMYLSGALLGASLGTAGGNGGRRAAVRRFARGPIFLSVVIGMAVRLIPWPDALASAPAVHALGGILSECLVYLGQGTTPVVLLALGVALRPEAARAAHVPLLIACGLKLLVLPLAMWVLCRGMGLHGGLLSVGVLQAAMPTAVVSSVLCAQNEMDGDLAVGIVFVSTVLSAITVPVLLSVLH